MTSVQGLTDIYPVEFFTRILTDVRPVTNESPSREGLGVKATTGAVRWLETEGSVHPATISRLLERAGRTA